MADLIKKSVASPAGSDPLTYVMSDETVDRMGDVIEAKGWQLANFAKNPIALFGHDHSFVIGHWSDVRVQGAKLIGKLNLLPAGISERLDEIRAAVEAGVLRAVSVGLLLTLTAWSGTRAAAGGLRRRNLWNALLSAFPPIRTPCRWPNRLTFPRMCGRSFSATLPIPNSQPSLSRPLQSFSLPRSPPRPA